MFISFSKNLKLINSNRLIVRNISLSTKFNKSPNVAVVLSGSGVYDGSELTEAASVIIHLSKHNANISFYAPNIEQLHVVNHLTGEVQPEVRNVLVESARIARGNIKPLDECFAANHDAVVFPGGFGAAKNLSDYALKNTDMTIDKEVARVINEFSIGIKPIGMCCISPVLAAKLFPNCKLTVGKRDQGTNWPFSGTIDSVREMGALPIERDVNEIVVDENYKLITTPAFMKNASFYEVFEGIGRMIESLLSLTKK